MNAYMGRFLDRKHLLRDFVSHIDHGTQNIGYAELQDDLILSTRPLLFHLTIISSVFMNNLQRFTQETFSMQ